MGEQIMRYILKVKLLFDKVITIFIEKHLITKIYNIISVLATLTIFSGLILFLYGKIVKSNQSDNDLIMKQIKKEVKEEEVISLNVADIHGFGNNSIIVTTTEDSGTGLGSNKLLILDSVDNEILRGMNDLLGIKSSYKTTFSYTLLSDEIHFVPETEYVIDILGDSTKEIIVKYYVWGSNYSANATAIFAYSYKDEAYKIIGTYPENKKIDLIMYNSQGEIEERYAQIVETCFNKLEGNNYNSIECTDGEKNFSLNCGSVYNHEYWIVSAGRKEFVTVNYDRYGDEKTYINVYETIYDKDANALSWNVIYSEYVDNLSYNYTQDELAKELMDIMDLPVTFIESYSN